MTRLWLVFLLLLVPAQADLEQKVSSVLPQAHERVWSDIPWRVDLNQARQESLKSGKPIFVWIMDGHVLAAT